VPTKNVSIAKTQRVSLRNNIANTEVRELRELVVPLKSHTNNIFKGRGHRGNRRFPLKYRDIL
jgi:hypothetical protein